VNGPEHYREAERLATYWQEAVDDIDDTIEAAELNSQIKHGHPLAIQTLAAAQVHATLALAAATVDAVNDFNITGRSLWIEAVGIR
jgi:hypothetical protein